METATKKQEFIKMFTGSMALTYKDLEIEETSNITIFAQYYGLPGLDMRLLINVDQANNADRVIKIDSRKTYPMSNKMFLYKIHDTALAKAHRKDMYLNAQGALMSIWFNDSPFFIEIDVYRFIKRGVNITVPFYLKNVFGNNLANY
jgi:hypothetical protein